MKNNIFKINICILLGLFSFCLPMSLTAAPDYTHIYYTSSNGKVVTPNQTNAFGANIISNEYKDGRGIITFDGDVTTIGNSAFYGCSGLTSVTIPNSVTTIGERAFQSCSGLTSITIPNSVTTIGDHAFYRCSGLTSVTIPNSVTTIGEQAFSGCTGLTSITCQATTPPTCGRNCFYNVSTSIPVYVPYSSIDAYKKANEWKNFTNIQPIPGTKPDYTHIYYTSSNGKVVTPNRTDVFGAKIVSNEYKDGRGVITFDSNVTTIGMYAFSDCKGLTSITIPNSVTTIGMYAFSDCKGLTSITIPNSVTTIGEDAFWNCSRLTSIDVDAANTHYASIDGVLFNSAKDTLIQYPIGNTRTQYTIPSSVKTIENWAFYDCSGLASVTIGNSVTTIGHGAFSSCKGLTSITIPNSVTTIGGWAFYDCDGLTSVTIPNSVTTIGGNAFSSCNGLTSITCQATIPPTCENYCFDGVTTSIHVYVPTGSVDAYKKANEWKNFTNIQPYPSGDDCEPISGTCGANLTWTLTCDSVLTISGTGRMNDYQLKDKQPTSPWAEYMDAIDSIYISEGVTTVGAYAFRNASNVSGVFLPTGLDTIYNYAFGGCKSLVNFILPEGLQCITSNAFYNIGSISKIVLPSTLSQIGSSGISCGSLTELTCLAEYPPYLESSKSLYSIDYSILLYVPYSSIEEYKEADIWKNFTNIQAIPSTEPQKNVITYTATEKLTETTDTYSNGLHTNAFNVAITSHTFANGVGTITFVGDVTTIGEMAFYDCSGLTSIIIPNSVTTIEERAFSSCDGLTSITIPNSVTTIGEAAFEACRDLTSVTIGNSVTTIGESAFALCGLTSITIPNSVKTIGEWAFHGCGLTSVTIPNSVTSIGNSAFCECIRLTSITCEAATHPSCGSDCFYHVSTSIPVYVPAGSVDAYKKANEWKYFTNIQPYPSGDDCEPISGTCGANLTWTLSCDSVLTISGTGAMYDYGTKNTVPWYLNRDKIKYCIIEEDVTTIGTSAFSGCSVLTSITIPNSVTWIGIWAFGSCKGFKGVYITDLSAWCEINFSDSTANPLSYAHNLYLNNQLVTDLVIPNSVTKIGDQAFRNCTCLTSVTIPNSVTMIGYYAFYGCSDITSIEIPNSVSTIGNFAFDDCSGLTSITCDAVTPPSCGTSCFNGVTKSIPLYVPYSSIEAYKQADIWKNFTNIQPIPGTEPQNNVITYAATSKLTETTKSTTSGLHTNAFNVTITSHTFANGVGTITFAGDVTTIGKYAFRDCSGLTSISIPNSVTMIGSSAFYHCSGLTSVTIPNSVTTIGERAFYRCSGLTSVTIPNSVTTIEKHAFGYCSGLTSINVDATNTHYCSIDGVLFNYAKDTLIQYPIGNTRTQYTIPNSVTTIGEEAFGYCSGLTSVIIPASVSTIGVFAFGICTGLTSITNYIATPPVCDSCFQGVNLTIPLYVPYQSIDAYKNADQWQDFTNIQPIPGTEPNNVIIYQATRKLTETTSSSSEGLHTNAFNVAITSHTFANGTGTITFAGDVTMIGQYAFYDSYWLESVTIPNSVTTIGDYAFFGCQGLTSVTIPNSVTTIGNNAFEACFKLTSVNIPNSVTTIGRYAFGSCYGFTSLTIPNSVKTIGNNAFFLVNNIVYNGNVTGSPWGAKCVNGYVDEYLVYSDASKITLCGCSYVATGEITIPNSVTTIGNNAFCNCIRLTSITIPNSVTTIGNYAVSNCFGLTSITIPTSVTTIGYYAFRDCVGLKSIICLATTPPTCGSDCFNQVSTTIPLCIPVGSVNAYKKANEWKNFTNIQPITGTESHITYKATEKLTETTGLSTSGLHTYVFNVPITSHTFANGTGTITFAGDVKTIGEKAFYYCKGLTSVTIPNSVTTIGEDAFYYCTGLTSITIPNSVTTIGKHAFRDCSGLTSISIPNSVITIGEWAFFDCSGLTSINVDAANTHYASIDGVLFNYAKDTLILYPIGNTQTRYTIPNSVTMIGSYAFRSGSGLTSVTIGNSVTTIGEEAFQWCSGLTSVTIPNSVTTIGRYAFQRCSGLTSITCDAVLPPTCGSDCFYDVSTSIPLYVPKGSISAYQMANEWKKFTNIQPIGGGGEDSDFDIKNTTTTVSELEAWVTVPLDAKGEVTKYSYWLYLDIAHTDLVCSMDFDATGKMSNPVIRKAPARQQANETQTFESFTFEVSGLEANTTYYYVLKAFTDTQTFVKEGSFTTQSSATRNAPHVKKVCKQNRIYIEFGDKTFDIRGNQIR